MTGGEPSRVLDQETEHTVKNHLAVIVGFVELVLADTTPGDPHHEDLQEINRAARELMAIFRQPST
jgi:two-component sensor histidine kinase